MKQRHSRFNHWVVTIVTLVLLGAMQIATCEPLDTSAVSNLSLRTAARLLREHSRDLRAAQRALDAARAGVQAAAAGPNPNVSLQTSNVNPHAGLGAGSLRDKTFDTQVGLNYLIERGDKRNLRVAAAAALERASGQDVDDALRIQLAAMANAYFDLRVAQERVRITHETSELFAATLTAAKQRLAAGDIAASDADRISIDGLRVQSDEQSAIRDWRHAQAALASLLGLEAFSQGINASDPWPGPAPVVAGAADEEIIARRPDVLAATARVDAAQRAREVARSQRTRDLTVAVTYDHWPVNAVNQQGTGNSYGVSISVPLFLGNHFDGDIAKAESDWGAALDQVEKVTAAARAELSRTQIDLENSAALLDRFDNGLMTAAQRVADAQEFAYQKGAIGVLDLLDARRTLRSVQFDAATAHADYAKALAAWRQARSTSALE